jgi:uncharacterized damage-inducible protein DinB
MIKSLEKNFNELQQLQKDIFDGLQGLKEEQRAFKPDAATWSINQVLEHLYLSETATVQYMKKKTSGGEQLYPSTFKHTWRAFLLKLFLRSSKKFKLPPKAPIDPSGKFSFAEITQKWNALRTEFAALLNNFDESTADKLIFKHPRAGYFNARQTIKFSYEHIHHHIRQIEGLKAQAK